jgi:thiosulfate dehydrogenase [quinone] large subunit
MANLFSARNRRIIEDPPFARLLFNDTRFSSVWFVIRVLIGLSWLQSGVGKLGNPAWMETGAALQGFWNNAVAIPEAGRPAIAFDWYRGFIQGMLDSGSYVWFAKLVAIGETMIGVALVLGAFVGVAALFAAFMNWNFVMAGAASSNALMGLGAVLLVLAWKNAGYYGLDYFLLPLLGTPWGRKKSEEDAAAAAQQIPRPGVGD